MKQLKAIEFFAGIGLVRKGLEEAGFEVVFSNDIEVKKKQIYELNFDAKDYLVEDIRKLHGSQMPKVDLATASFPCTDLSLAGKRAGLVGVQSRMFWEFTRILQEMGRRKPKAVLLENVPSFATSHGGRDLYEAIKELNSLGYWCEVLLVNANNFVAQSRPRLFIVGSQDRYNTDLRTHISTANLKSVSSLATQYPDLMLHSTDSPLPYNEYPVLKDYVESLAKEDGRWWDMQRKDNFLNSLSLTQRQRLNSIVEIGEKKWLTAYRRTRNGRPVWELRFDDISGCLRTVKGGSSKQAIAEVENGEIRVRWMTAKEYARLQGVNDFNLENISEAQALFALGDAVCVPVIKWVTENHITPLFSKAAKVPYEMSIPKDVNYASIRAA